jgi:hypothetical protein
MIISLEHIHLFISLMFILLQSHCAIKIIMITSDNIKVFIEAIISLLFKGHAVAVQSALPFALTCTNAPE